MAYSSPNWNGFSFTGGVTQAWDTGNGQRGGSSPAFEGKVSYAWAGDFAGKAWASGLTQKTEGRNDRANAWDLGATVSAAGFGLTGYYGQGSGTGTTVLFAQGYDAANNARDSDDWYLQATYTLPGVGTKLGARYGESNLDGNAGDAFSSLQNRMWAIGAYHPLTKHLNLVAEYADQKAETEVASVTTSGTAKTISLGAILFF